MAMFLGALFLTVTLASCDNTDFLAWKQKFSKKYNSFEAGQLAIKNWLENKEVVSRSHVDGGKWKAELGKYADMSIMEFEAMLLENTPVDKIQQIPRKLVRPSGDTSPNAFDWRYDSNTSVVTSVKDQGFVGTCWAFSTIENVEGQWALAGNDLTDLSPEYLVDCDGSSDDTHADCSIYGGWPYLAYDFIIGKGGVPSEASWPYCSGNGSCYPCMLGPISLCGPPPYYCDRDIPASCNSMEPAATISSWTAIESDEKVMAEALVSQGPLSVLIDATGLQYYKEGIWDGKIKSDEKDIFGCSKTYVNHAVLIVGYGTDGETDWWTVKNSWGNDWGEDGFFRIERGVNMCAINSGVTTSLV